MKLKGEQYTTHHCFVCGEENQLGLNMKFYETEDGRVLGIFRGKRDHCSYPTGCTAESSALFWTK